MALDVVSTPGDVYWANQPGFVPWWIKLAQKRKYGANAPEALFNHVFMVVGTQGEIIEANAPGMERGNLSDYGPDDKLACRRPAYTGFGARIAVAAMEELLARKDHYNYLAILSVAIAMLTGTRIRLGISGEEICSGAVAYALTRANIDCGDDESWATPADLMHEAIVQGWAPC